MAAVASETGGRPARLLALGPGAPTCAYWHSLLML